MIDFDEIYRDQAIHSVNIPGFQFLSAYTPTGIQQLDTRYCRRIMAFKKGESYTEYSWNYWTVWDNEPQRPPRKEVEHVWTDTFTTLSEDIKNDPHLHPTIKENLMFNLNNRE